MNSVGSTNEVEDNAAGRYIGLHRFSRESVTRANPLKPCIQRARFVERQTRVRVPESVTRRQSAATLACSLNVATFFASISHLIRQYKIFFYIV